MEKKKKRKNESSEGTLTDSPRYTEKTRKTGLAEHHTHTSSLAEVTCATTLLKKRSGREDQITEYTVCPLPRSEVIILNVKVKVAE